MRALFFDGEKLSLVDLPRPDPPKGWVLIKVKLAGICNTDLEILRGYMDFKGVPGHEFVGEVVEGPEEILGKRVVGEINVSCGTCDMCRRGLKKHCRNIRVLGIKDLNGAFSDYIVLPEENVHILPDNISDEEAVFVEPLAAAFQVLEQVHIPPTSKAVILGDGKLGLLISKVFSYSGIPHICVGKHEEKLEKAKKWGARTLLLSGISENMFGEYDVVVDATGREDGLKLAVSLVRPQGIVILKTTIKGFPSVDVSQIVVKEITLIGSRCGPFEPAIRALESGKIVVEDMIDSVFDLEDFQEAFERARGSLKVILRL